MDALRKDAGDLAADLVAWRRDLHRHPELAFEEHRTAAFVAERLRALGMEVHEGIARTGVLGILRAPRGRAGAILLRADMDALPIEEAPGVEYRSSVPGRMHACGHDGHVAMLLGAAVLLAARRDDLPRDVAFCFQPAEEGGGGAREMLAEGVLEKAGVGSAFSLHLWAPLPAGTLHVGPGPVMAAQDEFVAEVVGRGGHGGMPQDARDPVVAAALAVVALQALVARAVDPLDAAVVTVGTFEAGTAPNVIPERARLRGTLRSLRVEVRDLLRARAREVIEGAAAASGCLAEFRLLPGYPAVVNHPAAVERVRHAAMQVFGPDRVAGARPLMAAEDFAYFLERVPGSFALLGAGRAGPGGGAPHHSPRFDFEESVLPQGAELLARVSLLP